MRRAGAALATAPAAVWPPCELCQARGELRVMGTELGTPPCPEQALPHRRSPSPGHSEQLGGCPWPWLSPHLLLGAVAPMGWLPGATLLALGCLIPALWLTSCVSVPAPCCLHPIPAADPKAEPGEASTSPVALGEMDRPCLTGALTGEAFPLQTDSLAAQTFLCPAERSIGCGPAWCLPLPPVIAPALAPPVPPRLPLRWAAAWCRVLCCPEPAVLCHPALCHPDHAILTMPS